MNLEDEVAKAVEAAIAGFSVPQHVARRAAEDAIKTDQRVEKWELDQGDPAWRDELFALLKRRPSKP